MLIERSQVTAEDTWNVSALFPSFDSWQAALQKVMQHPSPPRWPEFQSYKGHLGEKPEILKEALEQVLQLSRQLSLLFTYAHLRHDEEITDDLHKTAYSQATSLLHDFHQETAWFEPELLALPEATIQAYLASPFLADYRFYIEKIVRIRKHMLSPESEELLALSGKALQTSSKAFSAINDADFKFGKVLDGKGAERELTHGSFALYIRDKDRILRENAFKQYHHKYFEFENTLCELLNGQIQMHLFNAKARHYSSCLEAALFPKNIDTEVYHALIKAVHSKLSSLHHYFKLRKRILNVDTLHLYDLYVPLTQHVDIKMPYKEAEDLVIESVAPLGPEYQNILRKGIKR